MIGFEFIERTNLSVIDIEETHDSKYVTRIFENTGTDRIYVTKNGKYYGAINIDNYCQSESCWIEYITPYEKKAEYISDDIILNSYGKVPIISNDDEFLGEYIRKDYSYHVEDAEVYEKFTKLNSEECIDFIDLIPNTCNGRYVVYGRKELARNIVVKLKKETNKEFIPVSSIFDMKENDFVIFLTFTGIKLYRKNAVCKINSFKMLIHLISSIKNYRVFKEKYIKLIKNLEKQKITFLYGALPDKTTLTCLEEDDIGRIDGTINIDDNLYEKVVGEKESSNYIASKIQDKLYKVFYNGMFDQLVDCKSDFYNVVLGKRLTKYQKENNDHCVYIFGPCTVRGALVDDENTIATFIQKYLNHNNYNFNVVNCGIGGGSDLLNTYKYILATEMKPGDIILFLEESNPKIKKYAINNSVNYMELADGLNKKKIKNKWFLDRPVHCNAEANLVIAESLYKYVSEHIRKTDFNNLALSWYQHEKQEKVFQNDPRLKKYLEYVKNNSFIISNDKVVGAICMNCNPMTRGHKYLIETALKKVDYLYVFVVSEDKSELPFSVRKTIVEEVVKKYDNVKVLVGGEIMASALTFPEYFNKENDNLAVIDASKDILTFCQHIVPLLNIKYRFVGSEPNDIITKQYNIQLKHILPYYGVELIEFERITLEQGNYISATKTRNLMKSGNWGEVSKYVPEEAIPILKEYYLNLHD